MRKRIAIANATDAAAQTQATMSAQTQAMTPATRDAKFAGYFFAMDHDTLEQFAAKVNGLKFGDKASYIEKILGKPDSVGSGHGFTFVTPVHHVYTFDYVIAEYRENLVTDGKDEIVYLDFDNKDQLDRIFSLCPEIKSR